jgi:hypothetical protein
MEPQNHHDGNHPDAMIKDFGSLLDNTSDTMHWVAKSCGTQASIKPKSRDKAYISDEQLHPIELYIYDGNNLQVKGLQCERIFEMCRCTGCMSCHGGN